MAGIVPETLPTWQLVSWQDELKNTINSVSELLNALDLPLDQLSERVRAQADFVVRVPRPFVARMQRGNINDPLLLQVLPSPDELLAMPGFSHDPLQEQQSAVPGLLHKYRSRVLLVTTGACAVNCRYCFRRHFPYDDNRPGRQGFEAICQYIFEHPEVNEVILSGGDPLAVPDRYLADLIGRLEALPQLTRLRFHTRLPIVIPSRITDELVQRLGVSRFNTVMVLHANHGNEIDESVKRALQPLRDAGVTLLNQAVLLKGVNDSAEAQIDLSEKLFSAGVLPYYLHVLDKVQGAAHFFVDDDTARQMIREMLARLPGFLVPRLSREVAGAASKIPLDLKLSD